MQPQHDLAAQLAAAALVSLAGIGEAVAQHPLAAMQCGQNQLVNMLGAVGKHQRQLRQRRKPGSPRAEQNAAQLLSQRGAAGLGRVDHVQPVPAQINRQIFQLRGLAYAVEPFKGDKFSVLPGHATDLNTKRRFRERQKLARLGFSSFIVVSQRELCASVMISTITARVASAPPTTPWFR